MTAHSCVASATEPKVCACASKAENQAVKNSVNDVFNEPDPNAFSAE